MLFCWRTRLGDSRVLGDRAEKAARWLYLAPLKTPPIYGTCCTLDVGNDKTGIALTGGTQYWIAVTTSSKTTFAGGWAFNSTDMRGGYPIASYCKGPSTYCGTTDNGKWVAGLSGDPLPAYAILGN